MAGAAGDAGDVSDAAGKRPREDLERAARECQDPGRARSPGRDDRTSGVDRDRRIARPDDLAVEPDLAVSANDLAGRRKRRKPPRHYFLPFPLPSGSPR